MTTWHEAKSADGPKLAAYIEHRLERRGTQPTVFGDHFTSRLSAWRRGKNSSFYVVDRVLTGMGMHPCEVPDDVWRDRPAAGFGS